MAISVKSKTYCNQIQTFETPLVCFWSNIKSHISMVDIIYREFILNYAHVLNYVLTTFFILYMIYLVIMTHHICLMCSGSPTFTVTLTVYIYIYIYCP